MTDPKPTLYLVTLHAEAPVLALSPEAACKLVQYHSDYASERCTLSAAPLDRIPEKWTPDAKVLAYRESHPVPTLGEAIVDGLAPNMKAWFVSEVDAHRMPPPEVYRAMWADVGVGIRQIKRVLYQHGDGCLQGVWICETDRTRYKQPNEWVAFMPPGDAHPSVQRLASKYNEQVLLREVAALLERMDVNE